MTNQASENELNDKLYDLAVQNVQDTETGEQFYALAPKDLIELIRTEKLKLLAEVRERVVGEDVSVVGGTDANLDNQDTLLYVQAKIAQNITRNEQRAELTKLEAEL